MKNIKNKIEEQMCFWGAREENLLKIIEQILAPY